MSKVWVTREGQRIPLEQMSDSHLRNAHRHMARRLARMEQAVAHPPSFNGEIAQMLAEHEFDHLLLTVLPWTERWVETFVDELRRRGLEPLPGAPARTEKLPERLAWLAVEVHEDEPRPHLAVHRYQAEVGLVEIEELTLLLHERA